MNTMLQSTQRGVNFFRIATADKFYLAQTIAGVSKQTVMVADYRIVAYIIYLKDALFPHNVSLNFNVCFLHDTEI